MDARQISVNLLFTFVLCISLSLSFATQQQIRALQHQVAAAEAAEKLREAENREDIDTTYKILSGMSSRWRLTANMQVRAYHYISPHEGPRFGCPECFDIMRRNGEAIPAKIAGELDEQP
jgi:hypothetical protein